MRRLGLLALGLVAVTSGCVVGAPVRETVPPMAHLIVRETVTDPPTLFYSWEGESDTAVVDTRHFPHIYARFAGWRVPLGRYRAHLRGRAGSYYVVEREP